MLETLLTVEIVTSVLIILLIAMQSKGNGLSIVPSTNDFGKFERRGPEKTLHLITIALVSVFVVNSLLYYLFSV
jgi:protein translocase SecG subunit